MTERKRAMPVDRLMAAMDRCAVARGEVQWTNGFRTAAIRRGDSVETDRLHEKEQKQWAQVDRAEAAFRRLAQRLTRGCAA